jgi:membrane protease YdiL (CAAX protease family)
VLLAFVHLGTFVVVLAAGLAMSGSPSGVLPNAGVAAVVGALAALYLGLRRHAPDEPLAAAVGLERPQGRAWWQIALAFPLGALLALPSAEITARILQLLPVPPADPEAEAALREAGQLGAGAAIMVIACVVVAAPLAEEALYRGLIQRRLAARTARGRILGTALLYAAVQLNGRLVPAALAVAVVLGLCMHFTRTAWASFAAALAYHLVPVALDLAGIGTPDPDGELFLSPTLVLASTVAAATLLYTIWRLRPRD